MDSTRSWAVAAGCCWINVFTFAILRSSAVIYVETLQTFPVTREEASWPVALVAVFYNVGALVAAILSRYVKIWKLTFAGSVMSAVAVSLSFFANGVPFLAAFLGVTHGMSVALSTLCHTVINQHFDRYKAAASGFSNAGLSIGGLLFPPLMQFLCDKYGLRGALLLCGGVILNSAAGSLLHRLPPKGVRPESVIDTCPDKLSPRDKCVNKIDEEKKEPLQNSFTTPFREDKEETETFDRPELLMPPKTEVSTNIPGGIKPLVFIASLKGDETANNIRCQEYNENKTTGALHGKLRAFSFLIQPRFYLILLTFSQTVFTMTTYATLIVDFAMDRHVSKWSAVILLTIYTAVDVVARLLSGWITDKGFLSRNAMIVLNLFLMATSVCLISFTFSYYLFVPLTVVSGWCYGSIMILIPVLFMELVEPSKFSLCYGIAAFVTGIPQLTRPMLVGYFRDTLGDYNGLFHLLAALQAFNAFAWIAFSLRKKMFTKGYQLSDKEP